MCNYDIDKKKEQYQIKVTTYIKGPLKDAFINDVLNSGLKEAELARKIIMDYYAKQKCNRNNY